MPVHLKTEDAVQGAECLASTAAVFLLVDVYNVPCETAGEAVRRVRRRTVLIVRLRTACPVRVYTVMPGNLLPAPRTYKGRLLMQIFTAYQIIAVSSSDHLGGLLSCQLSRLLVCQRRRLSKWDRVRDRPDGQLPRQLNCISRCSAPITMRLAVDLEGGLPVRNDFVMCGGFSLRGWDSVVFLPKKLPSP